MSRVPNFLMGLFLILAGGNSFAVPRCEDVPLSEARDGLLCMDSRGEYLVVTGNSSSKYLLGDRIKRIKYRKAKQKDLINAGVVEGVEVEGRYGSCAKITRTRDAVGGICENPEGLQTISSWPEAGGPVFQPIQIPMSMPETVFCGFQSKPVTRKGVTVCGCNEVIQSKLVTNPLLQEGQYCISEGKFYIAKECKTTVEGPSANLRRQERLYRDLARKNKELESVENDSDEEKLKKRVQLEKEIDAIYAELDSLAADFSKQMSVPLSGMTNSCQLEEASKDAIKQIRWVQKNQRMKLPKRMKGLGLPGGLGFPGVGPGIGFPVNMNLDDSRAPTLGGEKQDDTNDSHKAGQGK